MAKNKVLVIGLDGATLDVIRPMAEAGKLPVLSKLMNEGVWGELESTIPAITAPAWVSMMTGVNPGKHGVYFFLDKLHLNYGFGRTVGTGDIKFPPIWSILNENKRKVAFVNAPITYPPVKVDGVMISGMFIPEGADDLSYPKNLYSELVKRLGKYVINDWTLEGVGMFRRNEAKPAHYDRVIEGVAEVNESRKEAALIILEEKEWDYAMVVFTATDRMQHLFWKSMGPDGNQRYKDAIYNCYMQADKDVGELIAKAGKDTTVMITSDHGFGPLKKLFYLNKWLEEIGMLKLKEGMGFTKRRIVWPSLHAIVNRLFSIPLPEWCKRLKFPVPVKVARAKDELIDWERTKAYGNPCGININLRGREPYGSVDPSEREEVLEKIEVEFKKLRDDSGELVCDWIRRREEVHTGPFVDEAVDLYFAIKGEAYLQNAKLDQSSKWGEAPLSSGMHRKNGVFIMKGPHCRKGLHIKASIIDVTPTILYLMGVPLLDEMDGRILEEGISDGFLSSNKIKKTHAREQSDAGGQIYSDDDEQKIKESLEGLGYIS